MFRYIIHKTPFLQEKKETISFLKALIFYYLTIGKLEQLIGFQDIYIYIYIYIYIHIYINFLL